MHSSACPALRFAHESDRLVLGSFLIGPRFCLSFSLADFVTSEQFWNLDLECDFEPLYARIRKASRDSFLVSARTESSLRNMTVFVEQLSPMFVQSFGLLTQEKARAFVLFLTNALRWSIFVSPSLVCPRCSVPFYPLHLFDCPVVPTRVSPGPMISLARGHLWPAFLGKLFSTLGMWNRSARVFRIDFVH